MHRFEHSVEIDAPVERVFAFDANPRNWPRTMASLRNLRILEETDDAVRMEGTQKMLGLSVGVEMERTITEPGERFVVTVEGDGLTGELENRFVETETGTRIDHTAEFEYGDSLFDRVMEPVASRFNERQIRNHLQHTKEIVEAELAAEGESGIEA